MFLLLDKKGAEKMLSPYWFLILILVSTGIYLMATNFYSNPYDVRALESEILANKIVDCVSEKGELVEGVFSEDFSNNFLNKCSLILDEQYFISLKFFPIEDTANSYYDFEEGNKGLEIACAGQEKKAQKKLPACFKKRFYVLKDKKQFLGEVLTVVDKKNENFK